MLHMVLRRHVCCLELRVNPPKGHIWIGDDVLNIAIYHLLQGRVSRRHVGLAPGPLEARKRATKRRMMNLAQVEAGGGFDPSVHSKMGAPERVEWKWQSPTPLVLQRSETPAPLPSWLTVPRPIKADERLEETNLHDPRHSGSASYNQPSSLPQQSMNAGNTCVPSTERHEETAHRQSELDIVKRENEILRRRIEELERDSRSRRKLGAGIGKSGSVSTNATIANVEDLEGLQKEEDPKLQQGDPRRKALFADSNIWEDLKKCRDIVGIYKWAADNGVDARWFPKALFPQLCHAGQPLPVLLDAMEDVTLGTPGNLNFLLNWQVRKQKGEGVLRKRIKSDDMILLQQWMRRQVYLGLKTEDDIFVFLRFVSRVSEATDDESFKCNSIASIFEGLQSSSVFGFKDLGTETQYTLFKSIVRGPVTRQSLDLGFSLIKAMLQSQSEGTDQMISAFIRGVFHSYASLREHQKRETRFLEVTPRALEMLGELPQELACSVILITTKALIKDHLRIPAIKAATLRIPDIWWSAVAKIDIFNFRRLIPLKIEIELFLSTQKPETVVPYLQQLDKEGKARFIRKYWIGSTTSKVPLTTELEGFLSRQKPGVAIPYLQQLDNQNKARFILRYWTGPERSKIRLETDIELFLSTEKPEVVIPYLQQLDDQNKARFILRYWVEPETSNIPLKTEIELFISAQKSKIVIPYLQRLNEQNKARFIHHYWAGHESSKIPLETEIELFLSTQKPEVVVSYLQHLEDQDTARFILRYWVGPKTGPGQSRARNLFDEFCSARGEDSSWVNMFHAACECAQESSEPLNPDVKRTFKVLQMLHKSESIVEIIRKAGMVDAFIDESDVVYAIREHLGTRPHLAERMFHYYPSLPLEKCPELAERLILIPGSHSRIALDYMQKRINPFHVDHEAFSQVRIQLLDRMASAYSTALHLTPRAALRNVYTCFTQYKNERLGPPSVAMARALVRTGLIRPLQAGRWVGTHVVRWILFIVRWAEDPHVADKVDEVVYKWRRINARKLRAASLTNRRARYYVTENSKGFRVQD